MESLNFDAKNLGNNKRKTMVSILLTTTKQIFKNSFYVESNRLVHLLRLGPLACYYEAGSDLAPDLSRKLLSQLDECDNPQGKKVTRLIGRSADPNLKPIFTKVWPFS